MKILYCMIIAITLIFILLPDNATHVTGIAVRRKGSSRGAQANPGTAVRRKWTSRGAQANPRRTWKVSQKSCNAGCSHKGESAECQSCCKSPPGFSQVYVYLAECAKYYGYGNWYCACYPGGAG